MKEQIMVLLNKLWDAFTPVEQYALMVVGGGVVLSWLTELVGLVGVASLLGWVAGIAGGVVVLSLGWRNVLRKTIFKSF